MSGGRSIGWSCMQGMNLGACLPGRISAHVPESGSGGAKSACRPRVCGSSMGRSPSSGDSQLYQNSHIYAGRRPFLGLSGNKEGAAPRRVPPQNARCLMIRLSHFQSCSASASALTASSSSGPSAPMITSSLRPISSDNTAMTSFASATRPSEARAIQDSLWKPQAARTNLVAGRACRPAFRATVSCRSTKTDLLPAQMNL